jgi:hypothetical protein
VCVCVCVFSNVALLTRCLGYHLLINLPWHTYQDLWTMNATGATWRCLLFSLETIETIKTKERKQRV